MAEEIKDVNAKVDELEAAAKKYASKDTVISIGGYEFTPAKLMVAFTIVSSTLGGLYGVFEVYKDYQSMKKKIAEYVAPDLGDFDKRLTVIEQNQKETSDALRESANKTAEYTRDIKNDLKQDIRRLETVVEQVERSTKTSQRETDQDIRQLRKEVDTKIQKAMDNPLAGK